MEAYRKDLEYMIIGGLAVNYHGFQRATGDIDIWYNPTSKNYLALITVIKEFGFETTEIESKSYYKVNGLIRLPLDRFSIELLSLIDGKFSFEDAYKEAETIQIIETSGKIMSYNFLIENKLMARRPKDLEDVRQLELRNKKS